MTPTTETFRTVIQLPEYPFSITHSDRVLCIGSCFAGTIGDRLAEHKFQTLVNPLGILFNPLSIAESLQRITGADEPGEESLFFREECWHSYDFHSSFSHPDKVTCLRQMREGLENAREFVRKTDYLIITLGTIVAYRLKTNGKIVANCHKMPSDTFVKQIIPIEVSREAIEKALQGIRSIRPDIRCIITVSPVRHIRSGFIENSYSKACLRVLCQQLVERNDRIHYFPAYEIVTDDLRDYRFYASDRVHPSEEAANYIWQCFSESMFSDETRELNRRIAGIEAAFRHRPLFPQSGSHRLFCRRSLEALEELQSGHPELDFTEERGHFERNML